jgi:CBS domain containing-hemolysin-like protein
MMTDHDSRSSHDGQSERQQPSGRPNLFERIRGLFGLGAASVRDDIEDALATSSTEADLSAQERLMLKNVLDLHEVRVEDLMVPRVNIIAVSIDAALADVLTVFRSAGHSRLPVHGETLDDIRGMVHIQDFLDFIVASERSVGIPSGTVTPLEGSQAFLKLPQIDLSFPLSEAQILRQVLFVPPSMPALDLLVKMQTTRTHMALVIDEYGGTDGLASIEDIVEMIVGDIEDEHDLDEGPDVEKAADGTCIADGRAGLDEVSKATGFNFELITDAEDFDTIGGFVTALAGHVPLRGEVIVEGDFEFEIVDADPRRVKKIRIYTRSESTKTLANGASGEI